MKRSDVVFRFTATAYVLALTAACVAAFWPVYQSTDFVVMAVGALIAGTAVAVCATVWRWNSLVTTLVSVGVFLLIGVPLAVPGETMWGVVPTAQGFVDLLSSVALGWKQLITIAVPVGSYQALLTPAYVLAFGSCVVAVTVALRSRAAELAVVPPLVVFVLAIVLGSDAAATPLPLTVVVAGLAVGWLAWMRRRRRVSRLIALSSAHADVRRGERSLAATRSVVIAAVVLVLAVVASAGISYLVPPASARNVARTATMPPFNPRDYASPLSAFRSYLEPDRSGTAMFTVHGLGDVRRLRIATLDSYNGIVYSVGTEPGDSGAFARVPDTLSQPKASGRTSTLSITMDSLSGPWLPTFGDLEHIEFSGANADTLRDEFYYNAVTASMADTASLSSGDSYEVTAAATPSRTIAQLAKAKPGAAAQPALTTLPSDLAETLQRYQGDATTPGAKLSTVLQRLADTGYISHGIGNEVKSLSGHGADRINALLDSVPMVGDQEQYAVTAALMARQLGFPARVVLGFDVPQDASGDDVTFTGNDISAWIQVKTAKDGWVDVNPNPQVRPIPEKKPDQPKQISRPQSVVEPPKDTTDTQENPPPQSHVAKQHVDRTPAWLGILLAVLTVLGWTLLGLALVASPFLAVVAAKWRRRRARRSTRVLPRGRITGAWNEFADSAVDHGYSPPGFATRSEVAETVGGPRPTLLASVADRAAFGRAEPDDTDADQVWRAVDELRRDLNARTTRWGRLRAKVSLRSLGGYRGSRGNTG
ncbi:MAG TPA: transglutaminase-like domain-containing protein, partial [Humibacter sp.]|nr:transglutaminase-like domain-containing protein [Humibacter sp.]